MLSYKFQIFFVMRSFTKTLFCYKSDPIMNTSAFVAFDKARHRKLE